MRPLTDFREFQRFLASFTNYEKLPTFRYGPQTLGLERMRSFAADLGNPHDAYPSIHIGGTKGKGTTTLLVEALLRASGLRVGTYTSPHVEHLRERIRVDGEAISEDALVATANRTLDALEPRVDTERFPTFFELMTAIAMLHFERVGVDFALFEVGLGGRLDATNILSARMSAITSVGLEHTELLGDTLAAIAREKAGIIRSSTPVVCGELPAEAREVVDSVAKELGAPRIVARADEVSTAPNASVVLAGLERPVHAPTIRGPGLRADLAIAWRIYRNVLAGVDRTIDADTVERALTELQLPARVELFGGDSPLCLDGAHTVESIEALAAALDEIEFPRPRALLFSLASDKRRDEILKLLPRIADDVIFTHADTARSTPPEELRDAFGSGRVIPDPVEALALLEDEGHAVVVAGSIYLAGIVRSELRTRA